MNFLAAAFSLLFFASTLEAKVLHVAPLSVAELPSQNGQGISGGPQWRFFRCTNRMASPLELKIVLAPPYRNRDNFKLFTDLKLPGMTTSEVSLLLPCILGESYYPEPRVTVESDVEVQLTPFKAARYHTLDKLVSPSFTPDHLAYLFENFQKSPLPVREWQTDSRTYAGLSMIVLNSEDFLSEPLRQALRLAAARGTQVLVLVLGKNPWPSYAGVEIKGLPFKEKIGFGSWVVRRSSASESDPRWKKFVKRRHNASRYAEAEQWHETKFFNYKDRMSNLASKIQMSHPPIPMGRLTFVMICFVIIIGPVNFLVLKRYRRTLWAVVTTPLISLIFTGAVIASVIFGEGIRSKGRGEVKTILDQRNGIAATRGAFGIYAPLRVGDFRFTPEDVLYFYKPGKVRGEFRDNEYVYASSLVRPRMSFSYALCRAEERSEKIAVTEKNGHVEIVNGLGVKVDTLYLRDGKNQLFKLDSPLVPGARAVLRLIPKLPALVQDVEKNCYRATLSEPLFISPGVAIDQYEHNQSLYGRWR